MSAQREDILAWLEHAITRAEATARDAAEATGGATWDGDDREVASGSSVLADGVVYGDLWEPMAPAVCAHVALHDPAAVLRRCATDRKILALHAGVGHHCSVIDYDGDHDPFARIYDSDVCTTVRLAAEGYGWTEGER